MIDVRLRSEAAGWERGEEWFSRRILANLVKVQPLDRRHRIGATLAAAACVAVTAAALVYLSRPTRESHLPPTTGVIIPAGTQWAAKWAEFIPNPLALEAERLTSDTESGIRFVVACLNVRPLAANAAPRPGGPESPHLP